MDKKYKLTDEKKVIDGVTVYRIEALKDFHRPFEILDDLDVAAGELGGFVESEKNLSQVGGCWVANDAAVFGNAQVFDGAQVIHGARIYGNAQVFGRATIAGDAQIYDDATITRGIITDQAEIYGRAVVGSYLENDGALMVGGTSRVFGDARIIRGVVGGNSRIFGDAELNADESDYEIDRAAKRATGREYFAE